MHRGFVAGFLLAVVVTPVAASAAERPPVLTLDAALRTARTSQPQLARSRASVASASARIGTVGARRYPQLNGSAGMSVGSTAGGFGIGQQILTPGGVAAQYSLGLQASQLVWDFGRLEAQVDAAQAGVEAQRANLAGVEQAVDFNVRSAYYDAQAKRALVGVAQENLGIQERLEAQAKAGVAAGLRPEIDLAQLRSQRANAQVSVVRAEVDYDVARAVLGQSMGVESDPDFEVEAADDRAIAGEDAPLAALLEEALAARPEFVALARQLDAQQKSLAAARLGNMPSVGAVASTSHLGNTTAIGGLNWSTGLSLSWPILQGGAVEGQVGEAEAQVAVLQAQVVELRLAVRLEVERAQRTVRVGKRVVDAAGVAEEAAREQLRLAEGRWQAGVGNVLELGNAQANVVSAGLQRVQARQQLALARAQLLLAVGRRGL